MTTIEESFKLISESLTQPPGSRERCFEFMKKALENHSIEDIIKYIHDNMGSIIETGKDIEKSNPLLFTHMVDSAKKAAELHLKNDTTVAKAIVKYTEVCFSCQKETTFKCGRCKMAYYCSKECQVLHWENHKSDCKRTTTFRKTL